ncbi:MAG: COQ9 family protein [Rhodospirillales bacterium]
MIAPPERSPERDAALERLLPHVGELGWTRAALRRAAGPDADLLFPGGAADMVEAYIDLMDRRMVAHAAPQLPSQRLSQRVRTLIATRLELAGGHKPAARRAAFLLALPINASLAASCTARTVDTIWHAAGDTAADFSWYTKRAILAAVYTTTTLNWMNQATTDEAALAFLDRRLRDVARIGKLRSRIDALFPHPTKLRSGA